MRRAEIVQATIRCLARDGYSGLTMKKVARSALMISVTFWMMRGSSRSTWSVELTAQAISMMACSCLW